VVLTISDQNGLAAPGIVIVRLAAGGLLGNYVFFRRWRESLAYPS
jgi:hypothetical protein